MITGGIDYPFPFLGLKQPSYDITEVIDLSTKTSHIAGNLNTPSKESYCPSSLLAYIGGELAVEIL